MRSLPLALAALLALPLSGCLGAGTHSPLILTSGLFTFNAVERGETKALPFADCGAVRDALERRALDQARIALDQGVKQESGYGWGWGWRGMAEGDMAVSATPSASASAPAAGSGAQHSASGAQVTGTNNQEAAADEADLVKTDGEWTYVLSGGILHILHSDDVGDIAEVSKTSFSQSWAGGELLLERRLPSDKSDDRLVLVLPSQATEDQPLMSDGLRSRMMSGGATRIIVLSLQDRTAPRVVHEAWVEGHSAGARLVDGTAYVVVQTWENGLGLRSWVGPDESDLQQLGLSTTDYQAMGEDARRGVRATVALQVDQQNQDLLANMTLEDQLPAVMRRQFGFLLPEPVSDATCHAILSTPQSTGRSFTTIMAIDTAGDLDESTTQVVGGSSIVYADSGTLVLAAPSQDSWWYWVQPRLDEATDLLWFDLHGLQVEQRASGRVPGTVLDSFSLDVRGDELRVASTLGTWGRSWVAQPIPMTSQLLVLREKAGVLLPTGGVGGIAPGERIWSARFTDDRAYIVTFRQTDPLWIIDLTGGVPDVVGELKVAGVSTYLHPLGDGGLLTIGYGPSADGLNLDRSKIEVSLFDVSDPRHAKRSDVLDLSPPGDYSWSDATNEHRAFTYWPDVGTLAVPMTTQHSYEVRRNGGSEWMSRQHVGLTLVDVDETEMQLSLRGEVDQDRFVKANSWSSGIERSYFLGYPDAGPVSVYAVSSMGVTSHDLATLKEQGHVAFPQPQQSSGCCWAA